MSLHLAPDLELPLDAATASYAVLGVRGAGKSNAMVVMAEELFDAGIPWVAADPKGDWWGVRSSADGTGPGLPIPVFGGLHGDLPLEPTAGIYMADLIVDQNLTCVLDTSRMGVGERARFMTAWCHRLFDNHQEEPEVRHVFFEEGHRFMPMQVTKETAAMKEAATKLALEGRAFGIGATVGTQRPARLHTDYRTQAEVLVAMFIMAKHDRDAIAGWFSEQGLDGSQALGTLQSLKPGEAWILAPRVGEAPIFQRILFRQRRTFDSGATPKVGHARRTPSTLADVDLGAVKEAMAETIEKAKANDPAELRRTIAALQRELREVSARPAPIQPAEPITVEVEVPVLLEVLIDAAGYLEGEWRTASDAMGRAFGRLRSVIDNVEARRGWQDVPGAGPAGGGAGRVEGGSREPAPGHAAPAPRPAQEGGHAQERSDPPAEGRRSSRAAVPGAPGAEGLTKPQVRVLGALRWFQVLGLGAPLKHQVGWIAGYRVGLKVGGAYSNVLGELRSAGLIDYPEPSRVALTADGVAAGILDERPSTLPAFHEAVMARLENPEQRVLRVIMAAYPADLSKQEAGNAAGYTVGEKVGGAYSNVLGALRSLGLIDYPQPSRVVATPALFLEA